MKKAFIINGRGGVGKDTFCKMVEHVMEDAVRVVSSVDEVKYVARLAGWNEVKDEKGRKFLSDLKDLMTEYNDGPFEYIKKRYFDFICDDDYEVMFIHIREPKEIEKVVSALGIKTILVTNSNVEPVTGNHADADAENYIYDYTINNSGTPLELLAQAKAFVETYILEEE